MAITKEYIVVEEIDIDFLAKDPAPIVICPQFEDRGRAIKVKLKNGGEDFTVPSGYTPHVYMLKFDKKVVDNICEFDGSTVMVKITKQMSFVEGRNLMRIALVSDTTGEYAQTCEIYLRVTEGADVDGAEQSTDEFEALVMYANQAKDSASKAAQSETNAKASETAAIAARKGAEDAEGRVQAIVAGNEAYTKQQSHDLFAAALVTKTGPASSLEVYPDKLSNLKVYANGFTTQAGTGDPSPSNVRAITNGGLKLVKSVLTGSEDIFDGTNLGNVTRVIVKIVASPSEYSEIYCTDFPRLDSWSGNKAHCYANAWVYLFVPNEYLTGSGASAVKAWLAARYAAGNPVIVWYAPADESQASGLYAPIILTSGEYRATCLPLTAPLCDGDSVVSWVKSGCDQVITLTGENVRAASDGNVYFGTDSGATIDNLPTMGTGFAVCDNTFQFSNTTYWAGLTAGKFAYGNGQIGVYDAVNTTKELAQEYYNAHPLTVWYRSTAYTEDADIPVSLETHQQAVRVFNGTEAWQAGSNGTYFVNGTGIKPTGATATVNAMADYLKATSVNNTISGTVGFAAGSQGGFQVYLPDGAAPAEYLPEHPLTAVYPLATPITYAHPAVVMPALPDDTGKVTITGQSGGTVTVVFNKSIIKEIAEIKAAMLAMGANLSM